MIPTIVKMTSVQKVTPGLSSFRSNLSAASSYLSSAIRSAAKALPAVTDKVSVHVRGTAGMRLLSETEQENVWMSLYDGLKADLADLPALIVSRSNMGSIDGKMEAYYAVLASNYIAGKIDGNLFPKHGDKLIGALDMGGSSTQLVFHIGTPPGERVMPGHFWSHSWISFGAEKLQERLWEKLRISIEEGTSLLSARTSTCEAQNEECRSLALTYSNPCVQPGHAESWKSGIFSDSQAGDASSVLYLYFIYTCLKTQSSIIPNLHFLYLVPIVGVSTVTIEGSGDTKQCGELIANLLWPDRQDRCSNRRRCPIDDVQIPDFEDLQFFGMVLY